MPAAAQSLVVANAETFTVAADATYDDVTVQNGGTLVVNARLTVNTDMTVEPGAVVTHDPEALGFHLDVVGTLEVQATGSINVTGKGWAAHTAFNPGSQLVATPANGAGGSHGGVGHAATWGVYGEQTAPTALGSGGGIGDFSRTGGAGGGRIYITADTLTLAGSLLANGGNSSDNNCSYGGGGGAGGSVYVEVVTLEGSGVVQAIGGLGRGSGGGGRVALFHQTNTFVGAITVAGGQQCGWGSTGTVHVESSAGDLMVQGGNNVASSDDVYNSIDLRQGASFTVTGSTTVSSPLVVPTGANVYLGSNNALDNLTLASPIDGVLVLNAPFTRAGTLEVRGTLRVNQPLTVDTLLVANGGTVTHDTNVNGSTTTNSTITGTVAIEVQSGGAIDMTGKGWRYGQAFNPQTQLITTAPAKAGGSHGGLGGNGNAFATYDDPAAPTALGSGGGIGDFSRIGGSGGGRAWLIAPTVNINGAVRADGAAASDNNCNYGGGGGGGGTVRIEADTLVGSGTISAQGGYGRAAGGGGRVLVDYETNNFSGTVTALKGGTACGLPADDGTLFVVSPANDLDVGVGVLSLGSNDTFNSITLQSGSVLRLNGAATVTEQISIPAGATVEIFTVNALDNLVIDPLVEGTLDIRAPVQWPGPLTVTGVLEINDVFTVDGDLSVTGTGYVTSDREHEFAELISTGTVDFQVGSRFDMVGRGWQSNRAWNPGTQQVVTAPYKAGGSHAGRGAGNSLGTYGSSQAPTLLGSGGGNGDFSRFGGHGGGRIHITATTLILDGDLQAPATGTDANCNYGGGGGSGGSVFLEVGTFTGDGFIDARGGGGFNGGSGGRVAIASTTDTFTGTVDVGGGVSQCGQPQPEQGSLVTGGDGAVLEVTQGTVTIGDGDSYSSIAMLSGTSLNIAGAATVDGPVTVPAGATVNLVSTRALDNLTIANVAGRVNVLANVDQDDDMSVSGTLVVDATLEVNNLDVTSTGVVTHSQGETGMELRVPGHLYVAFGGHIDGDGRGLLGAPAAGFAEAGATINPGSGAVVTGSGAQNGGSHVAVGGQFDGGAALAASYDSDTTPIYGGGGGGQGAAAEAGGDGGGVVRIAAGIVTVDGTVSANGTAGIGASAGGGGGAGGTLVLSTSDLHGAATGRITATGGDSSSGGGAGGVLIASYAFSDYAGLTSAVGGTGGAPGADGTEDVVESSVLPTVITTPGAFAGVGTEYTYTPTAVGTRPIAWALQSSPPGATVDAVSGVVTWTPSSASAGNFVLRATNAAGFVDQSFTVTVIEPPAITSTASLTGSVGQPYHYNGSDTPTATGTGPITWSTSLAPAGFVIDPDSGLITWTPLSQGVQQVCIDATNAAGSAQQCFDVDVGVAAGEAPAFTSTPAATGTVGVAYAYDDDDTVAVSGSAPITFEALLAPQGLTIDGAGLVAWVPGAAGDVGVCLRATNPFGSDTQCFTVTVAVSGAGEAPAIASTPLTTAVVGEAWSYDDDGLPTATGSAPLVWSLDVAPTGMTVDASTGELTWTPDAAGAATACLVVTNPAGDDTQCFSVDVVESATPPQFVSTPTLVAQQNAAYLYDSDGRAEAAGPGTLTFAATEAPIGFAIDPLTGEVTWTPDVAGNFDVVLTAQNDFGTTEQSFTIAVLPDGQGAAPVIVHDANPFGAVGAPYVYNKNRRAQAGGDVPITWTRLGGPEGFTVGETTGLVTWIPTATGEVTFTLAASNAFGTDTYTFSVQVTDEPTDEPVARFVANPVFGDAPLPVSFDATDSFGAPGAPIASYTWDFGDGTPRASGDTTTHVYESPGSRVARLTVANAYGAESVASRVIRVADDGVFPPSARILISEVQGSDSLDVSFACECAQGDSPIASTHWDLGDGTEADSATLSHTFGPGGYTVRLTVVDENGLTATDSVFISVAQGDNLPPLLSAVALPTSGAAPLEVQFEAAFADVDGTVDSVLWTFSEGVTAEEPSPVFTFTEAGQYLVTVEVVDDQGLASTAAVDVEVTNDAGLRPPEILGVPTLTARVGVAYTYDDDGVPAARGSRPLTWELGKRVGDDTVGAPDGMRVDAATGAIEWTPTATQVGDIDVVLVARNDAGISAQEWTVTVDGDPVSVPDPPDLGDGGCGCRASGDDARAPALLFAALLGILLTRRRRARRSRVG